MLRELEAAGAILLHMPPGREREALLEHHRQRALQGAATPSAPRATGAERGTEVAALPPPPPSAGVRPGAPPAPGPGPTPSAPGTQPASRKRLDLKELRARAGGGRIDRRLLRRAGRGAGAVAAVVLVSLLIASQRERLWAAGRSLASLGHAWLDQRASRPEAVELGPPAPAPATRPPPSPQAAGMRSRRGAEPAAARPEADPAAAPAPDPAQREHASSARVRSEAPGDELEPLARAISELARSAPAGAGPARRTELQLGDSRFLVSTLRDPAGAPAGLLLWSGGPRARVRAAFEALAAWCSARLGGAREASESSAPESWQARARWATAEAEVELRARTNELRDTRVWSVDIRGGSLGAVEEAEVVLTYQLVAKGQR